MRAPVTKTLLIHPGGKDNRSNKELQINLCYTDYSLIRKALFWLLLPLILFRFLLLLWSCPLFKSYYILLAGTNSTPKEICWNSFSSVSSVSSVTHSCMILCDPMNHSTPGLPIHHQLPEFTQTHVHWVGDAITNPNLLNGSHLLDFLVQFCDNWKILSCPRLCQL